MQIAALSPKYVSTADVSEEYKAHEKEILMAQIQNDPKMAGKPEKVIEGAVNGQSEQRAEGSLPVRAGLCKGRGRQTDRCSVSGSGSKREQCKPDCKGIRSFRNRRRYREEGRRFRSRSCSSAWLITAHSDKACTAKEKQ